MNPPSEYDAYVRAEWAMLTADSARQASMLNLVRGMSVCRRVLDVGCGAGQEMRPLLRGQGRFGVGLDVSPEVGRAGRELFAREEPGACVSFVRAAAEQLPFMDASFDVVLCRVALPYMDNARVLQEIARVLTNTGAFVLRFHNARFYTAEFRQGIVSGQFKMAIHAMRVLLNGGVYHLSGVQPRGAVIGAETFQSTWLLSRELRKHGLHITRILPDSAATAPTVVIERQAPQV